MRSGLFFRLAVINIRKNRQTYLPYMMTCCVCIAMTYMMFFICNNPDLDAAVVHADDVRLILAFGIAIVCIFSVIFLLYSNSFLMKRRQKEIGVYNILGLEKRHIARVMFLETVLTALASLAAGLLAGILGSKLALLFLLRLLNLPPILGFRVVPSGLVSCFLIFGGIFFLTLLLNVGRVKLSRPIELLRGGNTGEREPKAKWLMAAVGFASLAAGYYLAVTTENPVDAMFVLFLAIILVMIGTYLLFTAGSIVILKLLRRRKRFYYKIRNFTGVSGMIYRMKQNAVGLGSVCILSTGVLLAISTTVCLYAGIGDIMKSRYPYDVNWTYSGITEADTQIIRENFTAMLEASQVPTETAASQIALSFVGVRKGDAFSFAQFGEKADGAYVFFYVITQEEYEYISGNHTGLAAGEVLAYTSGKETGGALLLGGDSYTVREWLAEWPLVSKDNGYYESEVLIVTSEDFEKLHRSTQMGSGSDGSIGWGDSLAMILGIDISGTDGQKPELGGRLLQEMSTRLADGQISAGVYVSTGIRQQEYDSYYAANGCLLFIGIFLGLLFLMGTAMIIYYKQLSEGYEDQGRFEIMQKVGMSLREVRSAIRRQILMVFFLPLLTAIVHICFAFPLISRMLKLFGMMNTGLFCECMLATVLVYAVVYAGIYICTARTYYHIVSDAAKHK